MKARRFKKVAVLMGGPSAERDVSLRSGRAVAKGLSEAGYSVELIELEDRTFKIPYNVEAVFIAMHGEYGEDGCVQKELDMASIPYTGSGALSSRLSFDKIISKRLFEKDGIPTARYVVVDKDWSKSDFSLEPPYVVKPPCQGSSIGCSIVKTLDQADKAFSAALQFGSRILVEEYIEGRELTVGLIDGEPLPVVEIIAPSGNYDYTAKYTAGKTQYLVPAPLESSSEKSCKDAAVKAYKSLGCRGFARVDIRLDKNGVPFVLELNSIPGFTETSLLPKAASCAGLSFSELCSRIMELADFDEAC